MWRRLLLGLALLGAFQTADAQEGGQGNVEDHTFNKPSGVTHGVGLRAYDPKTAQWAIWWVDSRDPHLPMDPPVKGQVASDLTIH